MEKKKNAALFPLMLNCSCPDAKYVLTGAQSIISVLESNSRGVYIKQSVRYKRIQHQNVEKKKRKKKHLVFSKTDEGCSKLHLKKLSRGDNKRR